MKSKMVTYIGEFTQEMCFVSYLEFYFNFSKVFTLLLVFLVM